MLGVEIFVCEVSVNESHLGVNLQTPSGHIREKYYLASVYRAIYMDRSYDRGEPCILLEIFPLGFTVVEMIWYVVPMSPLFFEFLRCDLGCVILHAVQWYRVR